MGADKPPIHFSSAHLSFPAIIITLWRLSVSYSLAEVWKSKQAGQDHLSLYHLVLSAYQLSMGIGTEAMGFLPCKLQLGKP